MTATINYAKQGPPHDGVTRGESVLSHVPVVTSKVDWVCQPCAAVDK
jgi:hypothetical protein